MRQHFLFWNIFLINTSFLLPFVMSVSIYPGAITFTVIPFFPYSLAIAFENPFHLHIGDLFTYNSRFRSTIS